LKKRDQKAANKGTPQKPQGATLKVGSKRRIITDSDDDEIANENEATLEKVNNGNVDAVDQ
jgi:hypothetical protein